MAGGALRLFTTLMTAPRHPCFPANGQSSDKSGRTVWSAPRLQCLGTLRPGLAIPALVLSCLSVAAHAANGAADGSGEAGSGSGDGAPQSESAQTRPSGLELPVPLFDRQIVVVGDRAIVSQLSDVAPEQDYEEDRIASYGASTVGELVNQIQDENGDDQPAVLVNGQPVSDIGDISDYPVEAVRKIETLPRGSAARVGGGSTQRVYNIVLKPAVKTLTVTGSREIATEGDWGLSRGEAQLTFIRKRDRINLSVKASQSDNLFETDRNLVRPDSIIPFAPLGNVISFRGTEIDPALSALAGSLVSTIALPQNAGTPTLASLVPFANKVNDSRIGDFRTLRGASQPLEASLSGNKTLAPWLSLSFNGRIGRTTASSLNGLPTARFLLAADHPASLFTTPVVLALSDASRPLRYDTRSDARSLTASLIATRGPWQGTLLGRYEQRERASGSILNGTVAGGLIAIDPTINPFADGLAALIPLSVRTTRNKTTAREVRLDVQGPLFGLPAGTVQVRGGGALGGGTLDATDQQGRDLRIERNDWTLRAGVTVPLTSKAGNFLGALGDIDVSADVSRQRLGQFGRINEHAFALNWRPLAWLRFNLTDNRDGRAIPLELVAAPSTIAENVPYFDPVRGETVPVTTIYGGGGSLRSETQRLRTLSVSASPWSRYKLQVNADYSISDTRNQFGALPLPTQAVVAAFPDRFVRDASGRLTLVDNRTVNFDRLRSRQLRLGTSFAVPLEPMPLDANGKARAYGPRMTMQVNAAHTIVLESTSVIRAALGQVNLLSGGAIGLGGGQQRHLTTANVSVMRGPSGFRLSASRRGQSQLLYGSQAAPNRLTFQPISTFDLRAIADMGSLVPKSPFWKGARISLVVDNIGNARQRVTAANGDLPLGFQPAYRDPIGRTVALELRKVF